MDYLKFEQPENNKTLEMLRFLNSGKVLKKVIKNPLFPSGSLICLVLCFNDAIKSTT
jgi:hypothetical protein